MNNKLFIQTKKEKIIGTSLQGYIKIKYKELVKELGEPHIFNEENSGYKYDVEWQLEFGNLTIVTIYNWKDGKSYCGSNGNKLEKIKSWHIGGHSVASVDCVRNLFPTHIVQTGEEYMKKKYPNWYNIKKEENIYDKIRGFVKKIRRYNR